MAAVQFYRHCQAPCNVMKTSQQTDHIPRNVIWQLLQCSNPCQLAVFVSQVAQRQLPLSLPPSTHVVQRNPNDTGTGKIEKAEARETCLLFGVGCDTACLQALFLSARTSQL